MKIFCLNVLLILSQAYFSDVLTFCLAVEAYCSQQEYILMKDHPTSETVHDGDYSGGVIFQKTEMFMIIWKLIFCFAFLRHRVLLSSMAGL